jgi:hypothetical protein
MIKRPCTNALCSWLILSSKTGLNLNKIALVHILYTTVHKDIRRYCSIDWGCLTFGIRTIVPSSSSSDNLKLQHCWNHYSLTRSQWCWKKPAVKQSTAGAFEGVHHKSAALTSFYINFLFSMFLISSVAHGCIKYVEHVHIRCTLRSVQLI